MKKTLLRLLPKNLISRLAGFFAERHLPAWLLSPCISLFSRRYRVDMSEAQKQKFATFNEFFTRALRPECRPIDQNPDNIVSPVDGVFGYGGEIDDDTLFQAKGLQYSLRQLVGREDYHQWFQGGSYLTLYLSPRHYHRIHTPVAGQVESLYYIPGTLYPVNDFAVRNIPSLFAINERLISLLRHPTLGAIAVIKVGATIVGKIKVVYDEVESNKEHHSVYKGYNGISMEKGQELGRFQLGSTVVLLFEKGKARLQFDREGEEIRYGEVIGEVVSPQL